MSSNAATSLLAQMLFGIGSTTRNVDPDEPDVALSSIEASGEHSVETVVVMPTGDRYRVTVEWLQGESP